MVSIKTAFRTLFISLLLFFGGVLLTAQPVLAGAPPAWDHGILPEDFNLGTGLFGAHNLTGGTQRPSVRDITPTVSQSLTADVNNDQLFGIANVDDGFGPDGSVYVFYGENDSGTHNFDAYLSLLDDTANVQPGWPVLIHGGGGIGGFHGHVGFLKMIPDQSRGVYLLYFTGAESGFGSASVKLTHFDENGSESASYPIDLGEFNTDMISDGSGGVFVLSQIGQDRDFNIGYEHGIVQHYTSAGLDAAWAGGAGQFVVSDYVSSQKHGATMMEDGAGGGIVLWVDDESGTARLIRGQRFLSTGLIAPNWTTAGDSLYGTAPMDFTFVRGASSGFGNYYATFSELGSIRTISFDENGDPLWSCTQDLGFATYYTAIGNPDPVNPGVFVITDGTGALAQHYEASNGNSTWQIGGEIVASGSDFNLIYPDQGFTLFFENKSAGMVADPLVNGVNLVYSISDPGEKTIFRVDFDRSTFAPGPGGDCAVTTPPDAIVDLGAVAGDTEVDLSWTEPADNGDPIIDYRIEYGETVGFPGNAVIFVDGVSAVTGATVTGLTNGTDYSFQVLAENGSGFSAVSNIATATPVGLQGRRRSEPAPSTGPKMYLGRFQELYLTLQSYLLGGSHGAADGKITYQTSDGGESLRNFQDDEFLRSRIQPQKENLLTLLDLVIQLRHLFGWVTPDDYQLLKQHEVLQRNFNRLFLTRYFHQMTGVEYLKRGEKQVYEFDYRDPIHQPTEIVADYQKSILLSYGKACYGEEVLQYAEQIDYVGNPDWYQRYVFIMKPWMDVVLGKNDYQQWTTTKGIDVLESLYLFLFGYCLVDELSS